MFLKTLNSFQHLSTANKQLILHTALLLITIQCLIIIIPFQWLSKYLGQLNKESSLTLLLTQRKQARRIKWAVTKVSNILPWESTCLTRAITAKLLLSNQNIESTLYLGASFSIEKKLEAHAWLRCGPFYLTGGHNHQNFGRLACYS